MTETNFQATKEDQVNLCLAYLTYTGEKEIQSSETARKIAKMINSKIPKIPFLCKEGAADWSVVWGPAFFTFKEAKYQDNAMFVVVQNSNPANYVVAIRGTNSAAVLDWLFEDFNVGVMHDWPAGGSKAKISEATEKGIDVLLHKMVPVSDLPGAGIGLEKFLTDEAKKNKLIVSFTGHSLGGALAPTLALHFKESQGKSGGWNPDGSASVSTIPFAGATAGNKEFASYSDSLFKDRSIRIHNEHDIVPHAWDTAGLQGIKGLYSSAGIQMDIALKILLDGVIDVSKLYSYTQIKNSNPFSFPIDPKEGNGFMTQAIYQHVSSYPLAVLGEKEGTAFLKLMQD